jgi:hypothetical protein
MAIRWLMGGTQNNNHELLGTNSSIDAPVCKEDLISANQRQRLLKAIEEFGRFAETHPTIEYDDLSFQMSERKR